ncbi:MAG: phosphatidylserine/phosphatidylglycerophosphate/cardiolipin synthase family protein [Gemmatimonadota bacterium]
MKLELLVGSDTFWSRLKDDLADARRSAVVQTFTFEGDRVGLDLADALEACTAPDRRLLVDGYSRLYHSDRWIHGPAWRAAELRSEVRSTQAAVRRLRDGGARVRFGNPVGPTPLHTIRRNHKKLIVVDERISYLGGINFSDHNFAWHDLMIRIESSEMGTLLTEDFDGSWGDRPVGYDRQVGPLRVISMNGRGNHAAFAPVVDSIRGARTSIDVVSAYVSTPFTEAFGAAASRGVRVRVLTPSKNNKPNLARHVTHAAIRHGLELLRYDGGMSHMKAMVIDGDLLIAGSSNFDFMSYHILEEHVVMTRDPGLVGAFVNEVWNPDSRAATLAAERPGVGTRWGDRAVRLGAALARLLARPASLEHGRRNSGGEVFEGREEATA